jgi:hypothetical protein
MGQILQPAKVKLIAGLLWGPNQFFGKAQEILARHFGAIDGQSQPWDFTYSDYYCDEMGHPLLRAFVSFEKLISAGDIVRIKLETNAMEQTLALGAKRTINIDPGYVALGKMVLASTKDGSYRVYLGEGIYGQSTLYFEKGSYRPWSWTYPDYRDERTITFCNHVRERLQEQR